MTAVVLVGGEPILWHILKTYAAQLPGRRIWHSFRDARGREKPRHILPEFIGDDDWHSMAKAYAHQ
jgi:hypothetical protein